MRGVRQKRIMAQSGAIRSASIGLLVAFALGVAAIAAGVRYNGTPSYPLGFYFACNKTPHKGDLVFVSLPSSPAIETAKTRGYLSVAYCSVDHLLKRLAGVAGDRVTIDSAGVEVNGIREANSVPLTCDGAGRPLQPFLLAQYVLGPGEILVMSEYSPDSFDSRYFGPIPASTIESVATPLLTFQ
jgi:conjugative transfer signal peptidase TraF